MTSLLKRRALALILALPLVLGLAGARAQDMVKRPGQWAQDYSDRKPDPDLKLKTALDRVVPRIAKRFEGKPLIEASIRRASATPIRAVASFRKPRRRSKKPAIYTGLSWRTRIKPMLKLSYAIHTSRRCLN